MSYGPETSALPFHWQPDQGMVSALVYERERFHSYLNVWTVQRSEALNFSTPTIYGLSAVLIVSTVWRKVGPQDSDRNRTFKGGPRDAPRNAVARGFPLWHLAAQNSRQSPKLACLTTARWKARSQLGNVSICIYTYVCASYAYIYTYIYI